MPLMILNPKSAALSALIFLGSIISALGAASQSPLSTPPAVLREFRGAWVATVANINWPSKPGLSSDEQKRELAALIEKAAQLKLNALIFQVRPNCDAFYASRFEPWSESLSGKMGQAPSPYYDPLAFAIEHAHRRGIEVHAWFNPFRVRHVPAKSPAASNHISRVHPEWVRNYGSYLWMDPAVPAAREYSIAVILDVLRRYDVDGIHLDDSFYPYKEKNSRGEALEFPDEQSWKKYRAAGGGLAHGDWRRHHIDEFVEQLHRRIKMEKSWVKFGISPFGIWRPGNPKEVTGLDAFEELAADSRKWLSKGWVDYLAPQLYWSIQSPGQRYPVLLEWWANQNPMRRHLWPGMKSMSSGGQWRASEIMQQIRLNRHERGVTGHIHWHIGALAKNAGGLRDLLAREVYSQPALVPPSPWLDNEPPAKPMVSVERTAGAASGPQVTWRTGGKEPAWLWIVQSKSGTKWLTEIVPANETNRLWPRSASQDAPEIVAISAVDRCGNVSPPAMVPLR